MLIILTITAVLVFWHHCVTWQPFYVILFFWFMWYNCVNKFGTLKPNRISCTLCYTGTLICIKCIEICIWCVILYCIYCTKLCNSCCWYSNKLDLTWIAWKITSSNIWNTTLYILQHVTLLSCLLMAFYIVMNIKQRWYLSTTLQRYMPYFVLFRGLFTVLEIKPSTATRLFGF